jgi:cobalt/nickel transport system ATP-binding protein
MNKAIEITNLSFSYPDGTKVLTSIDLDINESETVGIIGANGAGKTTLLLHLNGILGKSPPIKIFGLPVTEKNIFKIRRKVGIVFQNPDEQLFMPTVFDDIAFGPLNMGITPDEIKSRVITALYSVGLAGYEQKISHHLSSGEKKRVALATILSMEPDILVLDEPTSNLDPATRREFIDLLKKFNHTKIIAGHDMDMIKQLCTRVIVMNKGIIAAIDTPDNIFNNTDLLKQNRLK